MLFEELQQNQFVSYASYLLFVFQEVSSYEIYLQGTPEGARPEAEP